MTPARNLATFLFAAALTFTIGVPTAIAQTSDAIQTDPCQKQAGPVITKTIYSANINTLTNNNFEGNEILSALRNILCSSDKISMLSGASAFVIQATADQIALAERLIAEFDRPQKTYRLTYTITELDAGKTIGTQHFSMVVSTGQRTTMKEGDKIPVATGSYSNGEGTNPANAGVQTQFTYLDVGMNFDATLDEFANGVRLQSKVEQSSVGPSNTIAGVQEPVVRQSVLQGTSFLFLGKPVMLGSVDVPDSTRHLDIAVVLEPIK